MYYKILYKLKDNTDEKEWDDVNTTLENVKSLIIQLGNWIATIEGNMIYWLKSLEKFQVTERDYEFKSWEFHYITLNMPEEVLEYWVSEHERLEDISRRSDWVVTYEPHYEDITNKLFIELNIKPSESNWNPLKGIPLFENNILYIHNETIPFQKDSKIADIFNMLIKIRIYNSSTEVTYEEILELYNKWWYKKILKSDINEPKIRDIIKKKIVSITTKLKLDKPYMSVSVDKITFQF